LRTEGNECRRDMLQGTSRNFFEYMFTIIAFIGFCVPLRHGLERISTQNVMDVLEVPQRQRTAGAYRHLASLMVELGWTAVRVRDLTRGGYRETVRGYVRNARAVH